MNVEGIDAFAAELGSWIVNMAAKPYDGTTEAELFCPYHEHPDHSNKPSATWQPKAKRSDFSLGVMRCHRPGCFLPANAEEARENWREAQALRDSGIALPSPSGDADVIDIKNWKPSAGLKTTKPRPTKSRARLETPIDGEAWDVYREFLYDEPEHIGWFLKTRGISADTLKVFNWAWHQGKECYIYPVHRLDGEVEGWRLYDPFHLKGKNGQEARDKKRWFRTREHHHNQMYGTMQYDAAADLLLLWEGETDCMLAWQDGFKNSLTQTGGAGFWNSEWNHLFKGKIVVTVYDPDDAGQIGRDRVARELRGIAKAVLHIDMPDDLDYSEWRKAGHEPDEFSQLIRDAKETEPGDPSGLPSEGVPLRSVAELKDVTSDKIVSLRSYVAGKNNTPWSLPKVVEVSCGQNQGKKCDACPVFNGNKNQEGSKEFPMSPHEDDTLVALMGVEAEKRAKLLAADIGVRCGTFSIEDKETWHVEQVSIQDPVDAGNGIMGDTRYSAFHFYDSDTTKIEQSHDYQMVGRRLSDPRNSTLAVAVWGAKRTTTDLDNYAITEEERKRLQHLRPIRPDLRFLRSKLNKKYRDLAVNVTKIAGRPDLHLLFDLVAHSVHSFTYNGVPVRRGMMDALVVGDTRTGKSEMVSELNKHYGIGYVVSGENSSFAGLVGGSAEMSNSRERMPDWGVLPRYHKRMVVIDEVSGLGSLLGRMSDVRSSGIARINKMGGGEVPAMVRLLWMGNPPMNDRTANTRAISEYRRGAVDVINELIKSQEDIARFDIAMAVVMEDVPDGAIFELRGQDEDHAYTSELCHSAVMFAWTRKPEQITFAPGVTEIIQHTSSRLSGKYVASPPLVQGSNIDIKLARMCVALATMTYSTQEDGETVVVRPEHVTFIEEFMHRCYDHEHFGYGRMSAKRQEFDARGEESKDIVRAWILGESPAALKGMEIAGQDFLALMEHFESGFAPRDLREMNDGMPCSKMLQVMTEMGMLQRTGGQRYILSKALRELLRELEAGK